MYFYVIHNILGETLYTNNTITDGDIKINITNWTPGIYYLVIEMENKNLTHRFVVE